eukprot:12945538-Ditylum_brightwellii.AAC.1
MKREEKEKQKKILDGNALQQPTKKALKSKCTKNTDIYYFNKAVVICSSSKDGVLHAGEIGMTSVRKNLLGWFDLFNGEVEASVESYTLLSAIAYLLKDDKYHVQTLTVGVKGTSGKVLMTAHYIISSLNKNYLYIYSVDSSNIEVHRSTDNLWNNCIHRDGTKKHKI